ncbi:MAG: hypothetical protein J6A69_00735 [Clostridia bacterium]|nr:hypothetical protein [Clostridia bacterium]
MIFDVDFEKIEFDNCIFYRKDNAEKEEFDLIQSNIKKAGYVKIADNEFADAVFATYTDKRCY